MLEGSTGNGILVDPSLTASLYAPGRLDQALARVVAPLRRSLEGHPEAALWWVRSLAGGEHLKLRFHLPGDQIEALRGALTEAAGRFFAESSGASSPRRGAPPVVRKAPPIDPQDRGEPRPPGLVWTSSPRSALSYGGAPLGDDPVYAARLSRVLGLAGEAALDLLATSPDAALEERRRILLGALVDALAAPGIRSEHRAAYLAYHRDALARHIVYGRGTESGARLVAFFDHQAWRSRGAVERLRRVVDAAWEDSSAREPAEPGSAWRRGVAELLAEIERRRDEAGFETVLRLDPDAPDPILCPLFKGLHGLANQLGLTWIEEAFTHHLLWRAGVGLPPAPPAMPELDTSEEIRAPSQIDREAQAWKRSVERHGEEGRRWMESYRHFEPLELESSAILDLFRARRNDEAWERLQRLREEVDGIDLGPDPSLGRIVDRWLFGVEAYAHYCLGDHDAADRSMAQADQAVTAAIGRHRFLACFAIHCQEFRLHRARIARNARLWGRMREHLEVAEEMGESRLPLCVLDDGTELRLAELEDSFRGPETAEARLVLWDPARRRRYHDAFVQQIRLLPDLVLPWT